VYLVSAAYTFFCVVVLPLPVDNGPVDKGSRPGGRRHRRRMESPAQQRLEAEVFQLDLARAYGRPQGC